MTATLRRAAAIAGSGIMLLLVPLVPTGSVVLAQAAATAANPTVVLHVRPDDSTGHLKPGYTIAHRYGHAQCFWGSEATRDAYRCFTGNLVIDPCWVTHRPRYVDCLPAAWSRKVARLHITRGIDSSGYDRRPASQPWGVKLRSGRRCSIAQGASGFVGNRHISYTCEHSSSVLVGRVDKSAPVWRIRNAKSTGGGHYRVTGWANIAKAWFGRPSRKG